MYYYVANEAKLRYSHQKDMFYRYHIWSYICTIGMALPLSVAMVLSFSGDKNLPLLNIK